MPAHRDSRLVRTILIVFFVLLILYAAYAARGALYGPVIAVSVSTITVHEPYTLITGRAERITELRLNGKPIPVTEDGDFSEPYLLAEGSNHLILEARDSRGRTTQETLDVMYVPHREALSPADES